ncbi:AI-2E family transporter [Salininema proteolyticum]|uniref:AI-2E family transporter n=1 Tax=Salininema proteolyticum TaxID=1607685 RepID=A0ABV8TU25_9ACTN
MSNRPEPDPVPARVPGALIAAALVIVVAGLKAASGIVAPIALAFVLVIAVSPLQRSLRRHGWPTWLGVPVLLVALYALLISFAVVAVASAGQLVSLLPQYESQADAALDSLQGRLSDLGFDSDWASHALSQIDPGQIITVVTSVLSSLSGTLTGFLFLMGLLLFTAVDAVDFPDRLDAVAPGRSAMVRTLRRFASDTRRYLVVSTVFGLVVAVVDGIGLWFFGVPLPILWALLAFVTNYIPNIGFVIGLAPPALLAFLEGGAGTMLGVIAFYSVVNFVLQSVVQPKVVGDSVNLSVTLTFIALIFWTWVIGGLGAVLAVPLTLLAKALLVDSSPSASWIATLMRSGPPRPRRSADAASSGARQ